MATSYEIIWQLTEKVCKLLDGQTILAAKEVLRKAGNMIEQTNTVRTINNEVFNDQITALQKGARDIGESIP
ncbi:MAG: hypothetical protein JXA71_19555 [Chitinispirillaceae bacterium]|nr:hypothetical protein [Chitinispirillaceae bacterium]